MPIAVGVVGLQHGARHARDLLANPRARLAAVCDLRPEAMAPFVAAGAQPYPDYRALLASDLDAVVLALPHALHAAAVEAAAARRLPMLLEKPVATTADDCERIVAAVAAAGVPLLVGQMQRHAPGVQALRRERLSGVWGRLVAVHGQALGHKPPCYFASGAWKSRAAAGGGPLFMNTIHDLDRIRYVAGEIVEVAACTANQVRGGDTEDTAAATLQFADGAIGTLLISDTAWAPECPHTQLMCTGGGLGLVGWGGPLTLNRFLFTDPDHHGEGQWDRRPLPVPPGDAFAVQMDHFLDVVEGRTAPLVTAADGARSVACILAIRESARLHRAVRLPWG